MQKEYNPRDERVDHVWITIEIPGNGHLRAVVSTLSLLNRDAGFDGRVRTGIVREQWEQLPEPGIFDCERFDYADIESKTNVFYEHRSRSEMEVMLAAKAGTAILMEAWGDIYAHDHPGVHQIHSRRKSCAVARDQAGHDGALKFYFREGHASELLLFKFCGQP